MKYFGLIYQSIFVLNLNITISYIDFTYCRVMQRGVSALSKDSRPSQYMENMT